MGETKKIIISFDIDVPTTVSDSILNSIVLGLYQYKNEKDLEFPNKERKIKSLNKTLMTIQSQIDDLIKED